MVPCVVQGYRLYLFTFGLDYSNLCQGCDHVKKTALHVFFEYLQIATEKNTLAAKLKADKFGPEDTEKVMLTSADNWQMISDWASVGYGQAAYAGEYQEEKNRAFFEVLGQTTEDRHFVKCLEGPSLLGLSRLNEAEGAPSTDIS